MTGIAQMKAKIPQRGTSVLTGLQVRMARAALRISAAELARRSGVSERTVWRIEQPQGVPIHVTVESLERIRRYFEAHGVTFIPDDKSDGPGVRFRVYP